MMYIYITDTYKEGYVTVAVCDNGPGFKLPAELAIRPFISGKPLNAGMGFGLYIANETMKQMKGYLNILSDGNIELPENAIQKGIVNAIVALSFPKAD